MVNTGWDSWKTAVGLGLTMAAPPSQAVIDARSTGARLTGRRRPVVALALTVILATVCILFVQGARAWGFAADRHRRAQEIAAREPYLYQQLSDSDAVLESQRRIYMERFRRREVQLRQRDQDVAALQERLVTMQSPCATVDRGLTGVWHRVD